MWEDIVYLGVGGFLLGSLAYTGWFTTRYEAGVKPGYALIGFGATVVVAENIWLEFQAHNSHWFLVAQLIGYAIVAAGLIQIVRIRRKRQKGGD